MYFITLKHLLLMYIIDSIIESLFKSIFLYLSIRNSIDIFYENKNPYTWAMDCSKLRAYKTFYRSAVLNGINIDLLI